MEIRLKKQPHEQQQKFIDCDVSEQLYGGAKRGGKSVALCQKAILLNSMFPGNRGLLCRYNFTDLADTTLAEFFEVCPSELILNHHKGDRTIVLRTIDDRSTLRSNSTKDGYSPFASRQLYRGLGDPEDFEKVKGLSLGHLEIDEPSEVPFEQFLMLNAQLTWQLAQEPDGSYKYGERPPYMTLLASNPEPGWVEERYPITQPEVQVGDKIFIPSLPSQNPHLPPNWVSSLSLNAPKEWVEKYIKGIWGTSEGAIFKELDEKLHDLDNWIDPSKLTEFSWPLNLFLSIDPAETGFVGMLLVGVDFYGNIYCLAEYQEKDKLVSDHCYGMREKIDPFLTRIAPGGVSLSKSITYKLIDPAARERSQRGSQGAMQFQALADLFAENGFSCIPAWNAVALGLAYIQEHLHPIPVRQHPFTGLSGAPSLFISKSACPVLWQQMHSIKKKVRPNGYVEFIGADHVLDNLRYIVLSRPRRPELATIDRQGLSSAQLFAHNSHDKWVKSFENRDNGTWHKGILSY